MKYFSVSLVFAFLIAGCEGPSAIGSASDNSLRYASSNHGSINVRGRDYPITKTEGFDSESGELFVVEYMTKVEGRTVRCVGTIDNCPEAIEKALDSKDDEDHGY